MLHPEVADMKSFYLHAALLLPRQWLVFVKLAATIICLHHDCNCYQCYPHTLQASLCLQIVNEVCETDFVTKCTGLQQRLQVSDCLKVHMSFALLHQPCKSAIITVFVQHPT